MLCGLIGTTFSAGRVEFSAPKSSSPRTGAGTHSVGYCASHWLIAGSPFSSATATFVSTATTLPVLGVYLRELLIDDLAHLLGVFVRHDSDDVRPRRGFGRRERHPDARPFGQPRHRLNRFEHAVLINRLDRLLHLVTSRCASEFLFANLIDKFLLGQHRHAKLLRLVQL